MSYRFKVGDKGKTRGGRTYRVICDDVQWTRPANGPTVIALLDPATTSLRGEEQRSYDPYGKCRFSDQYDLLPPTVTKWLNVWMSGRESYSDLHSSVNEAEAQINRINIWRAPVLVSALPVEVQES